MTDRNQRKKDLEWNIGAARIEFIGEAVSRLRIRQHQAISRTTKGNVRSYLNVLETLYRDIKPYIQDEDFQEKMNEYIEEYREELKEDPASVLQELKDLDEKLNQKRVNLGLDIPSKSKPEEGEELLQ